MQVGGKLESWRPVIDSILRYVGRYRQGLKKDYGTPFYIKTRRSRIERIEGRGIECNVPVQSPDFATRYNALFGPPSATASIFLLPLVAGFSSLRFPFNRKLHCSFRVTSFIHSWDHYHRPLLPPPPSIDTNSISVSWSSSKNILILVNWLHAVNVQWTITRGDGGTDSRVYFGFDGEQMLNRSVRNTNGGLVVLLI